MHGAVPVTSLYVPGSHAMHPAGRVRLGLPTYPGGHKHLSGESLPMPDHPFSGHSLQFTMGLPPTEYVLSAHIVHSMAAIW